MVDPKGSKNGKHWLDYAAVWAAVAAALAAAVATAVGARQASISNQALAEARKENEIATRPYIWVSKLNPLTPQFIIYRNTGEKGVRHMTFDLQNFGKLPGLVSLQTGIDWEGQGHPRLPNQPDLNSNTQIFSVFPEPVAQVGTRELRTVDLTIITQGQIDDLLKSREGRLFIKIHIGYPPDYETQLCTSFQLRVEGGNIRFF